MARSFARMGHRATPQKPRSNALYFVHPHPTRVAGLGYLYWDYSKRQKDLQELKSLRDEVMSVTDELNKLKASVAESKASRAQLDAFEQSLKDLSSNPDPPRAAENGADAKSQGKINRRVIRIGTRDSLLAMWQAKHVEALLKKAHPALEVQIVGMKTLGDKILNVPLSNFSNKGVFTKELDTALLSGHVDIAVHSMKDLPTILPDGLVLCAVPSRGTVEDALVLSSRYAKSETVKTLETLPRGAVVGTSALRRRAVIRRYYPGLAVRDVRGNLQTRIKKLDAKDGGYDALLLARTGLSRLGLQNRISQVVPSAVAGHAVSQGALAVVCRSDDPVSAALTLPLNDTATSLRTAAERSLLLTLEGGCKVPIAVTSEFDEKSSTLTLHGWVISLDGKREAQAERKSQLSKPLLESARALGAGVAADLKAKGAESILLECRGMDMGHQKPAKAQQESNES